MSPAGLRRLTIAALLFLGAFSFLFSVGAALDLWPPAPAGRFVDLDLAVGLAFGVVLFALLLRGKDGS